jgi:MFS family permease
MWVMAAGTAFYAVGTTAVALFTGFWGFWLCMVITTVGELVIVPTATTYTANKAPTEMRGRYMSIYNLTYSVASATAPVLGGMLNDNLGPRTIWLGGGVVGIISIVLFSLMAVSFKPVDSNRQSIKAKLT